MPLDAQALWDRGKVLLAERHHRHALARDRAARFPFPDRDPRAPATEYRFADGIGSVGFIASVSRPFCLNCNRLRLTADGKLRYCLFAIEEDDVKGLLRGGATDDEIAALIRRNVAASGSGTRSTPRGSSRRRGRCTRLGGRAHRHVHVRQDWPAS